MYFWTLPVTVALGAVGAAETSLTTGWTLGTVVVTGEVAVGAGLVLKVMTWGEKGDVGDIGGDGGHWGGWEQWRYWGGWGQWGHWEDWGHWGQ